MVRNNHPEYVLGAIAVREILLWVFEIYSTNPNDPINSQTTKMIHSIQYDTIDCYCSHRNFTDFLQIAFEDIMS